VVVRHAYDGSNVWADTDASNNLLVRYTWGPGTNQIETRTTASGANAGVEAYFTDRLGSVVDIQNWASGALVDHVSYTGPGVRTDSNAVVGDGFGYTGAWADSNTGLVQDGRRWYDPKQGRWISEDPIGFAGGQSNLSAYVGNDPTNLVDPNGTDFIAIGDRPITDAGAVGIYHYTLEYWRAQDNPPLYKEIIGAAAVLGYVNAEKAKGKEIGRKESVELLSDDKWRAYAWQRGLGGKRRWSPAQLRLSYIVYNNPKLKTEAMVPIFVGDPKAVKAQWDKIAALAKLYAYAEQPGYAAD
jgi:RHS repeat-associated protein